MNERFENYRDFCDARLMLDVSNTVVSKEKEKTVGLLHSLREKIKKFKKYPSGKKLYVVVSALIKVIAGAAITTTAALKVVQMIKKSEITFEEFLNQKDEFDKPLFPAPVRFAVQGTLASLRIFARLMGLNFKSNKAANGLENGNRPNTNLNPLSGRTGSYPKSKWENYLSLNRELKEGIKRAQELEQRDKPVNMQYSNEPGGILDTVFNNNSKGIMISLYGLKNMKEVKNSGADISGAIDDVKDILAEAQEKMSDRAHRLASQSATGGSIQKDLTEAHMRIARINFILKQKGALSGAASRAIQVAQELVTKMAQASKRMKATDSMWRSARKRKCNKKRLVTHDSMPWSKRKHRDGVISNIVDSLKKRLMTIIAICKSNKNKLYTKIFIVANEIIGALSKLVAAYFGASATFDAARYISAIARGRLQLRQLNEALANTRSYNHVQVNENTMDPLLDPTVLVRVEMKAVIAGLGMFLSVVSKMANKQPIKYAKKDPNYLPE